MSKPRGPSRAEIDAVSKEVLKKTHINFYEHKHFASFYWSCIQSSFMGLLLGAIIEEGITTFQDHFGADDKKRLKCGIFVLVQLTVIAVALYLGNTTPFVRRYLYFDDWLMSTFAGFLFALTFINVQTSLSNNMTCLAFGK